VVIEVGLFKAEELCVGSHVADCQVILPITHATRASLCGRKECAELIVQITFFSLMVGLLPGDHPHIKIQRIKPKIKTPYIMERNGNNAEGYPLNDTRDGLHSTDKQNKQFSESIFIFNFFSLLLVSNLLGSSSGRYFYTQYSMLHMFKYHKNFC